MCGCEWDEDAWDGEILERKEPRLVAVMVSGERGGATDVCVCCCLVLKLPW